MSDKSIGRQVIEHLHELVYMSGLDYSDDRVLSEEFLLDYPDAEGLVDLILMKIDYALKEPGHLAYNWAYIEVLKVLGYTLVDHSYGRLKLITKVGTIILPKPF